VTAVASEVQVRSALDVALCSDCGTRPPRNRWGGRLPRKFPETVTPQHIDETLRLHPWLEHSRLGQLAKVLRDIEVSNV
jgi:NMD protein affecting ribosome stability and mRNA decay